MSEPSRREGRLVLAGGIVAATLLGGGGFMLGRTTSEPPKPPVSPPPPAIRPAEPAPPMLGRADLIRAAAAAADALAAGLVAPPEIARLDGRRFELRLPFGCRGPAPEDGEAPLRWRYDEEAGTLRVHVAPVRWLPVQWGLPVMTPEVEAVEGFWIARAWTTSERCPAAPPGLLVAPPVQTLALAQFFTAGGSRLGRRDDQPFEAVAKVAPDRLDVSQGLRLRLSGRIATAPGDGPVLCRAFAGPDAPPVCAVAVTLEQLAFENPATGEVIATWDVAREGSVEG